MHFNKLCVLFCFFQTGLQGGKIKSPWGIVLLSVIFDAFKWELVFHAESAGRTSGDKEALFCPHKRPRHREILTWPDRRSEGSESPRHAEPQIFCERTCHFRWWSARMWTVWGHMWSAEVHFCPDIQQQQDELPARSQSHSKFTQAGRFCLEKVTGDVAQHESGSAILRVFPSALQKKKKKQNHQGLPWRPCDLVPLLTVPLCFPPPARHVTAAHSQDDTRHQKRWARAAGDKSGEVVPCTGGPPLGDLLGITPLWTWDSLKASKQNSRRVKIYIMSLKWL